MISNSLKVLCPRRRKDRRKKKNETRFMGKIYLGRGRVAKGLNYLKKEKETAVKEGEKSIYFANIDKQLASNCSGSI